MFLDRNITMAIDLFGYKFDISKKSVECKICSDDKKYNVTLKCGHTLCVILYVWEKLKNIVMMITNIILQNVHIVEKTYCD